MILVTKYMFWGMKILSHDYLEVLSIGHIKQTNKMAAILESKIAAMSVYIF